MRRAARCAILLLAILLAHRAPAGWSYPPQCCAEKGDACREVPCSSLSTTENGQFLRHDPTGVLFWPSTVYPSPDGSCHACWEVKNGVTNGWCVIMPRAVS